MSKLAQKLNNSISKHKNLAAAGSNSQSTFSSDASNLIEYLNESQDFELIIEKNSRILRCYNCSEFLSSPVLFSSSFRLPLGRTYGSLATGLSLSEQVYEQWIAGKCDRLYHQKEAFIKHLSSKTHINATEFMKSVNEGKSREVLVTKNQLRAAIGIMKTKSAAIQYEERIAELYAAGSDVSDFGHSRKLFPAMLSAWPVQCDPAHWLNKVFSKLKDSSFAC